MTPDTSQQRNFVPILLSETDHMTLTSIWFVKGQTGRTALLPCESDSADFQRGVDLRPVYVESR